MKRKQVTLRAFLLSYDDKVITFARVAEEADEFTHKFLNTYYPGQNKTLNADKFKVRVNDSASYYVNKKKEIQTELKNLIDCHVLITVEIKHYFFKIKKNDTTETITGWHMTILDACKFI